MNIEKIDFNSGNTRWCMEEGQLLVDYRANLKRLMEANFTRRNSLISEANFPVNIPYECSTAIKRFKRFHFKVTCRTEEVNDLIVQRGCRSTQPIEFLHWFASNKKTSRDSTIVCLGQHFSGWVICAPEGTKKILGLAHQKELWMPSYSFLCVENL